MRDTNSNIIDKCLIKNTSIYNWKEWTCRSLPLSVCHLFSALINGVFPLRKSYATFIA